MIRTEVFAIAPSATAAVLARRWLGRRWLFFILPVVACLIIGLTDWRWVLVALMTVFVLWPMALFFVWTDTALRPEAVRASQPHCLQFDESGFSIFYEQRDGYSNIPPEQYEWSKVTGCEDSGRYMTLGLRDGGFVRVPAGAVGAADWVQILRWCRCT